MFGRYVFDDARIQDPRDPYGIFPEQDFTRNQFVTITENHIFSPTTINSIRFGFVRVKEASYVQSFLTSGQISAASKFSVANGGPSFTADPLTFQTTSPGELPREDGQNAAFSGIVPVGPDQNRPDNIIQNKFSGGDDLTMNRGGHSIKIGVVVTRIQTQNLQTAYANGVLFLAYTGLNSDAQNYLQGKPSVAFGVPPGLNNATRYFREIAVAPYIQDDWKVTSQLTLNLGFRYDFNTNPVGWAFANRPNALNFQPRFGFAYSPFKDNKTAIRGGVGVFFDPTAARLWESNFINTAPSGSNLLIGPAFPNPYAVPGFVLPPGEFAGVTYQPTGGSPYEIQYSFGIQRQITPATILNISYVGSVSLHLWTQGDINPPKCLTFPDCTALPQIPTSKPTVSNATYTVTNICSDPAAEVGVA